MSYPFIFEYFFGIDTQLAIWKGLYFLFVIIYFSAFRIIRLPETAALPRRKLTLGLLFGSSYRSYPKEKIYWLFLSAAGCMLFLSVTNVVTYEITPCPLLWVIPLCIYLLSFVLTFRSNPFYPRWMENKLYLLIGFSTLLFFLTQRMIFPILFYVIAYFISLFYFCIFCQYKLYQSRPQDKNELTFFYLIISLGGFLGSLLVTWLAPLIFSLPLEYLLGIFVVSVSVAIKGERISVGSGYIRFLAYLVAIIFLWPIVFRHYNFFALTLIIFMFYFIFKELGRKPTALYLSILALLFIAK